MYSFILFSTKSFNSFISSSFAILPSLSYSSLHFLINAPVPQIAHFRTYRLPTLEKTVPARPCPSMPRCPSPPLLSSSPPYLFRPSMYRGTTVRTRGTTFGGPARGCTAFCNCNLARHSVIFNLMNPGVILNQILAWRRIVTQFNSHHCPTGKALCSLMLLTNL